MIETGILLCQSPSNIRRVYTEAVQGTLPISGRIYTKADIMASPADFRETTCIFSTWGMPAFTESEIEACFPALQAVFYAAGSVQGFAAPFLARGVKVFSAWQANAIPVAEFTLAQILLSNKGYFASPPSRDCRGNYGAAVGIIGVGMIGRRVIELLGSFSLRVLAFDAFLPAEEIAALGAEKVSLPELFARAEVVSNHLANNEATRGMLDYDLFSRMRPHATFINTGRGAQVVEDDLVRLLRERPDVTALLDVTDPEPPVAGHPFYTLPNCRLSPHIAGSLGDEVARMGEYMARAYLDHQAGIPSPTEVTVAMLATMA